MRTQRDAVAPSQDELREHLVATLEAAPELPKEDRRYLADVFLDQLNAGYDLIPRGTGRRPQPAKPAGRAPGRPRWVPIVLALAFLLFVVPAVIHHVAIFLFALVVVFLAVRGVRARRSSTGVSG